LGLYVRLCTLCAIPTYAAFDLTVCISHKYVSLSQEPADFACSAMNVQLRYDSQLNNERFR
jgi:hypothetical protein